MKKAFTLIELLAVLIILGIITGITLVIVSQSLANSEKGVYEAQIKQIEEATSDWIVMNSTCLDKTQINTITLGRLKYGQLYEDGFTCTSDEGGFIDENITNPTTDELFEDALEIEITYEKNQYVINVIEP